MVCIASAGCTALALATRHEVVAIDINGDQLAYAKHRLAGAPASRGTAERVMDFGRMFAPLVGWSKRRVHEFLALDDCAAQVDYWLRHLDTRRFRAALRVLFSVTALVLHAGFGATTAADVVLAMLTVAASLEAFLGVCLGCLVFARLMRAGVIPEAACEACNDLWGRATA